MKKMLLVILVCLLAVSPLYAASESVTTTTSVTVPSTFGISFYDGIVDGVNTSIRYPNGQIAFPAYDPTSDTSMIMTSAWTNNDGKSDVGVVCRTNIGQNWALKVKMASATAQPTNVAIYKPDVVYIRNTGGTATTGLTKQWYIMSNTDETIFTGSGGYQNTAPFGVLATFSFAILPTGQASPGGQSPIGSGNVLPEGTHSIDITYTMTTTL